MCSDESGIEIFHRDTAIRASTMDRKFSVRWTMPLVVVFSFCFEFYAGVLPRRFATDGQTFREREEAGEANSHLLMVRIEAFLKRLGGQETIEERGKKGAPN